MEANLGALNESEGATISCKASPSLRTGHSTSVSRRITKPDKSSCYYHDCQIEPALFLRDTAAINLQRQAEALTSVVTLFAPEQGRIRAQRNHHGVQQAGKDAESG
jgi:hypothetical protein